MSTKTKNLKLTKPDVVDDYDIAVQNENMDIIDTFFSAHTSDASAHITSEERTAWNNKLDSNGIVAKATADAEGNNIIDTYATKALLESNISSAKTTLQNSISTTKTSLESQITTTKTSLEGTIAATKTALENSIATATASIDENIASTKIRKVKLDDVCFYLKNSGSELYLRGFVVDNMISLNVSGFIDSATGAGGANAKIEKVLDDSVFGDMYRQVNIGIAVPMINGTVRTAIISVTFGRNVITEFVFTKNGQTYKTYNYNDYGNDSSYTFSDMLTHSGVSLYFQGLLDSTMIKYPLAINGTGCCLVEN